MEPVLDGLRTVEVELLAEPELLMARVYIYIRFALILQKKNLFQIFAWVVSFLLILIPWGQWLGSLAKSVYCCPDLGTMLSSPCLC